MRRRTRRRRTRSASSQRSLKSMYAPNRLVGRERADALRATGGNAADTAWQHCRGSRSGHRPALDTFDRLSRVTARRRDAAKRSAVVERRATLRDAPCAQPAIVASPALRYRRSSPTSSLHECSSATTQESDATTLSQRVHRVHRRCPARRQPTRASVAPSSTGPRSRTSRRRAAERHRADRAEIA